MLFLAPKGKSLKFSHFNSYEVLATNSGNIKKLKTLEHAFIHVIKKLVYYIKNECVSPP